MMFVVLIQVEAHHDDNSSDDRNHANNLKERTTTSRRQFLGKESLKIKMKFYQVPDERDEPVQPKRYSID